MPAEITMPQLSDTMSEGTVVKWLKAEGEKVREGEKIAEVETDKAVMEMEAFEGGTVALLLVKEGEKVAVGAAIAVLASSKENVAEVKAQYGGKAASAPAAAPAASAAPWRARPRWQARPRGRPLWRTGRGRSQQGPKAGRRHARGGQHRRSARGRQRRPRRDAQHGEADLQRPRGTGGNGNGHPGRSFVSPLARRIAADQGLISPA